MTQTIRKIRRVTLLLLCSLVLAFGAWAAVACGASTVTLTFVTNGGTEIAPITAEAGATITPPANPEKDGFLFGGWFTSEDFSGSAVRIPSTMPDKDTTYYAQFTAAPQATLTLVAGEGGTLAAESYTLAVGENVSSFLSDIKPTPVNPTITFGGWFNGNSPLSTTLAMPANGLTLTARYRVAYTVEAYLQQPDGEYEVDNSVSIAGGEGWLGETLLLGNDVLVAPEGYHIGATGNSGLTLGIENNVYRVYFDIDTFSVVYVNNAPEGTVASGNVPSQTGVFKGATVQASENGYTVEGYRFAGWAVSRDGAVVYAAGDDVVVDNNIVLYACWNYGMRDFNGGADKVYILQEDAGKALLVREGLAEQTGTYQAETRTFSFTTKSGNALRGKVSEDGKTFVYYREAYAGTYSLYDWSAQTPAVSSAETLELDGYNAAIYTGADGTPVAGTYRRNGKGFDFASESDNFYFELGSYAESGMQFRIRDDLFGQYPYFSREASMTDNTFTLSFDGFGSVVYSNNGNVQTLSYTQLDDGEIQMTVDGQTVLYGLVGVRYSSGETRTAFTTPDAARGTYVLSDTVSIRCNGFYSVVYIDGTQETQGSYQFEEFYQTEEANWGLILAQFTFDDAVVSVPVMFDLAGKLAPERLNPSAGTAIGMTDYAAIRMFGEQTSGTAFVCVMNDDGEYVPSVRGTYTAILEEDGTPTNRYRFEAEGYSSTGDRAELEAVYGEFVYGIFIGNGNQAIYVILNELDGTTFSFKLGDGAAAQDVLLTVDGFGNATFIDGAGSHETIYQYLEWAPAELTDYGYLQFMTEYSASGVVYTIQFELSALETEGNIAAKVVSNDVGFYGELNHRLSEHDATIYLLSDNVARVYVEILGDNAVVDVVVLEGTFTKNSESNRFTFTATGSSTDSRVSAYRNFSFVLVQLDEGIVFSAYVAEEALTIGNSLTLSGYGTAVYNNAQYYYEYDGLYVHLTPAAGTRSVVLLLSEDKKSYREADATRGFYFNLGDDDIDYDNNIFVLDGCGNATLYSYINDELTAIGEATYEVMGGVEVKVTFKGTVPQGFEREFKLSYYVLRNDAGEQVSVYIVGNEALKKEYEIVGGGRIVVDAYNQVTYYDEIDFNYAAVMVIVDDEVVVGRQLLYVGVYNTMGTAITGYYTYAIASDGVHLNLLDDYWGTYTLFDGSELQTAVLTLDGLGNATYTDGATTVKGTYVMHDTYGEFIAEGDNGFAFAVFTVLSDDNERVPVFIRYNEEHDRTVVTDDWAIVILDGFVSATYIDEFGFRYEVYYEFINNTTVRLYGNTLEEDLIVVLEWDELVD